MLAVGTSARGQSTTHILQASPNPASARPGQSVTITYNWNAGPMSGSYMEFVHFNNSNGTIVFGDDHAPPTPTTQWSGSIADKQTVQVPSTVAPGTYTIVSGLDYPTGNGTYGNVALSMGPGVTAYPNNTNEYVVGTLNVTSSSLDQSGTCPSQAGVQSAYPNSQTVPFSSSGPIGLFAEGPLQTVYNHNTNSPQVYNDLPDSVVSAFHDPTCSGTIMIESQIRAYAQVGSSPNTLESASSTPVYQSVGDTNYADEKYHEWLAGSYTDDGTNVYALVHDEWYEWLANSSCSQSNQANARIDNVTLVVSTDGGATFHHPPNYKVFKQASPWPSGMDCNAGWHVWGPSEPSNIVKQGGYYYATYWQGDDPSGNATGGTCVARTADITNAGSWQVHTSGGWVAALSNNCTPIAVLNGMHSGLAWSSYLSRFIIIGSPGNNGYYYISTSPDMVTWSSPEQILNYNTQIPGATVQANGYPTFMDPSDTNMTFQELGQDPYVYFIIQPNGTPLNSFNIVRQRIHFD